MQIETINHVDFSALCQEAKLMNGSAVRPKMFITANNEIFRIFYQAKTRWSRSYWKPKAKRFQRNSQRLAQSGISTVQVTRLVYQPTQKYYAVFYPKLPGQDMRQLGNETQTQALNKLPAFIAQLHAKGIFFSFIAFR